MIELSHNNPQFFLGVDTLEILKIYCQEHGGYYPESPFPFDSSPIELHSRGEGFDSLMQFIVEMDKLALSWLVQTALKVWYESWKNKKDENS